MSPDRTGTIVSRRVARVALEPVRHQGQQPGELGGLVGSERGRREVGEVGPHRANLRRGIRPLISEGDELGARVAGVGRALGEPGRLEPPDHLGDGGWLDAQDAGELHLRGRPPFGEDAHQHILAGMQPERRERDRRAASVRPRGGDECLIESRWLHGASFSSG